MSVSIAVFGATGQVGSTLLIQLMQSGLLKSGDRVVLAGRSAQSTRSQLMAMRVDLLDAFDEAEVKLEVCTDLTSLRVDLFIMTAGATISETVRSRRALAEPNAPILAETALALSRSSPDAFVLIVTNPVELGVAIFSRFMDRKRVMGMGAQQDSMRFSKAIASRLGIHRSNVRASILGEHGECMVPMWSWVYLVGQDQDRETALDSLRTGCEGLDPGVTRRMLARIEELLALDRVEEAYEFTADASPSVRAAVEPLITADRLRSTPNATANAVLGFIAAWVVADERRVDAQVLLDGEFCDLRGVCGAPIQLHGQGWRVAAHGEVSNDEAVALQSATVACRYTADLAHLACNALS